MKSKYAIRDAAVTSFEVNGNFTADDSISIVAVPVVVDICGNCDNHGKPPYFCKNCNSAICEECKDLHATLKMMKGHEIVRQEDHFTCSKHPGEELKFMCDCGDAICSTCVAVGHDGHKKTTLFEAADKNKAELQGASLVTRRADAVRAQARLNVEEFDRGLKVGHDRIELWEKEVIVMIQRHVRGYMKTTLRL
jgi:hypothetical protein